MKKKCCKKYRKKGNACKSCPTICVLGKKARKQLLKKLAA